MDTSEDLRGADKREAFHRAAEEKVHTFSFAVPEVDAPKGRINCFLAKSDSCGATMIVLRNNWAARKHYHPNQDGIWLVVKGQVRFYVGDEDRVAGVFGPMDGMLMPENSRYWFEAVGDEEAWLLQISGYPKGRAMKRKVNIGDRHSERSGGVMIDLTGQAKA